MRASRPLWASLVTVILSAAALAGPASAGRPIAGCPPGFIDGAFTLQAALEYKAPLPPEAFEYFSGYFAATDKNGDGLVCMKDLPDTPGIPPSVTQLMDNVANS